jgi:hypothetical protein
MLEQDYTSNLYREQSYIQTLPIILNWFYYLVLEENERSCDSEGEVGIAGSRLFRLSSGL